MARGTEKERSFKYNKRTKENVRDRANMRGGNFDTFIKSKYKMYKVKDGKNLIRVLPPTWEDATHYGYDVFVNYGIGVDNQSYLSLSKHEKGKDPLAEARKEAERDGDKDLVKALQPRQRIGMWVIDRLDEDEGPMFWAAPFSFDKDLANLSMDEDTKDVIFIDDPEKGCDVRFYKEGQGLKTKYDPTKIKILKPSPIHEDEKQQEEWIDYITENPIPECLQFYDYDHISTAFDGKARIDNDDDEKPRKRRAARDDDEDDDEKLRLKRKAEADDDDDSDEKPSKRRVAAADEDEDEERPTRRSRRGNDDENEEPDEKSSRRRPADDDEDETEAEAEAEGKSKRSREKLKPADDDEDEADEKLSRRKASKDDDESDEEEKKPSLRDRIRKSRKPADDDD